jgi:hypothetical protein
MNKSDLIFKDSCQYVFGKEVKIAQNSDHSQGEPMSL